MKPVIFGLEGKTLGESEKAFLKEAKPAGIILFTRNIENPDQVSALTDSLRDLLGYELIITIDQEGGRVQRLSPPHWRKAPPMRVFGKTFEKDPDLAERALYLNVALIAHDLRDLGINTNCLPLLDVPVPGADKVIGDRAFSDDPQIVARLGQLACDALVAYQVLPVIKHIPGHGRARADSHHKLPVVKTPLEELEETDFIPFKALNYRSFAMTAHITYTAIDPDYPATLSKRLISGVIRENIGFKGLLISDDITMKALSGGSAEAAEKCLAAGIDLVLHCSGDLKDMEEVMKGLGRKSFQRDSFLKACLHSKEGLGIDERYDFLEEYRELEAQLIK